MGRDAQICLKKYHTYVYPLLFTPYKVTSNST